MEPRTLPHRWRSTLGKLRTKLEADGLMDVLDSFPSPATFVFHEATIRKESAIKLRLGSREQEDGTQATSWAYVMRVGNPERWNGELKPPVLIRDEMSGQSDTARVFKRSATSLLRKAGGLLPPFCFLQFDPHNNATHVRDVLCALVLYYSLVNGLTEAAIKWSKFETSLMQALQYVDNSPYYQQWQGQTFGDPETVLARRAAMHTRALSCLHDAEGGEEVDANEAPPGGGTVRSAGSLISVKPNTNMAKLVAALGSRVYLLDAIPPTPITFDLQKLFPVYSAFRLHFGKSGDSDVYVYLTQDLKGSTKILARDDEGELLAWTFTDLTGIQLVEPFAFFMRLDQDLRSRGNKIRYLVFYYFMLAENAGLINVSKTQTSFQSMVPVLCAACKLLKEVGLSVDTADVVSHPDDANQKDELQLASDESLIVKFRVQPEVLKAATGTVPATQRDQVADSDEGEEEMTGEFIETEVYGQQTLHGDIGGGVERANDTQSEFSEKLQPLPEEYSAHHNATTALSRPEIEGPPLEEADEIYVSATSRAHSRDGGSASSYVYVASLTAALPAAEALPEAEPTSKAETAPGSGELIRIKKAAKGSKKDNAPQLDGDAEEDAMQGHNPNIMQSHAETRFILLRATSVLSISSEGGIDMNETMHLEQKPPEEIASPPKPRPIPSGNSHIIDLCSDDEVVVTPESTKRAVEQTLDFGMPSRSPRSAAKDSNDEELQWPDDLMKRKRRKHKHAYFISGDEDDGDEVLEDVDGEAWKSASLRQSRG